MVLGADPALAQAKKKAAQKPKAKPQTVGQVLKMIQTESRGQKVQLTKYRSVLPQAKEVLKTPAPPKDLRAVKPPSSQDLFKIEGGGDEAAFEKITDQSIAELYKITQRQKTSPNRGELWLRLAELYVEKARLVEYRKRDEFDKKMQEAEAKKSRARPKLDLRVSEEYNKKAIQLYEWFIRDYPKDKKVDQALFFLGYNYFEINDPRKGSAYYQRLTKEFPRSPYVSESHFALGEYHFENSQWKDALVNYESVMKNRRSRLYTFALYKGAWCSYRLGKLDEAMRGLEKVVVYSREKGAVDNVSGRRAVNRIRLASEALKDLLVFFADSRQAREAEEYFTRVGGEKVLFAALEKLAYRYSDIGKREDARFTFKWLLDKKPTAPKAFDYQYQIVTNFSAGGDQKIFREELYNWINDYGADSEWARANAQDKELIQRAYDQRETTLRNYTLQLHKTAQINRAENSQASAANAYALYTKTFPDSKQIADMRFFYGELLYDMQKYPAAAVQYLWVVDNAPKSKYHENAIVNALLALEKELPSEQELQARTGKSNEPVPFGPAETRFEAAANKYVTTFPKGDRVVDVKFKLGRLHYAYNHYDQALAIFQDIVQNHSKSKNALYSANLTLDIYNLRKDYVGIIKAASDMLNNEGLRSQGFGEDARGVLERASFKQAELAERDKKFLDSAKDYETFAKAHPRSELATSAQFNSAVNFERAGQTLDAIRMYGLVLNTRDKNPKSEQLRTQSRQLLARLYELTGQYEKAAREFESIARDNPKDPKSTDLLFNAALIRQGLQSYTLAIKDFEEYQKRSRKADRKEVSFFIAEIHEKRGALTLANSFYQQYIESYPSNAARVVEAHYRIASIHERMGRKTPTRDWYQKTVNAQARLAKNQPSVGAWYAAEAKFKLALPILEEFKAIRIPGNPKGAEAAVQSKLKLIGRLNTELQQVIKYDSGDQVVGALAVLGQAYDQMFRSIEGSPIPKGLKPEEADMYRKELRKVSEPFQKQAIENFTAAIERAGQLRVATEWTQIAIRGMQQYDPVNFVDYGEAAIPTEAQDYMGL
ncbi:MAG TPA: tetratricopeptide repeat protein [Bdellovibrionales bacterium]|nr:tetratricopeptide repeat protein [Bdellovibrionales bacterium]